MRLPFARFALSSLLIGALSITLSYAQQSIDAKLLPTEKLPKKEQAKKAHKGWRLVWVDEFKGNELDTSSWERCPRNGADWGRHMSNLESLVEVEDGVLKLYGINRPDSVEDSVLFLTGGVQSRNRRSLQMGRIDVRARFDCGTGFWPAIWLMPDVKNLRWPLGGEIDIMEHLNYENIAYQTVHSPHTLKKLEPKTQNSSNTPIDPKVFNVYSVVIEQDAVIFYINGEHTFTYEKLSPAVESQFPFADHPFYVILSAQLGGEWVGEIKAEDLPVRMDIDYVRFYEKK